MLDPPKNVRKVEQKLKVGTMSFVPGTVALMNTNGHPHHGYKSREKYQNSIKFNKNEQYLVVKNWWNLLKNQPQVGYSDKSVKSAGDGWKIGIRLLSIFFEFYRFF
jgi:hypothetical protein